MAENQTILELQHISKYFPGVKALDDQAEKGHGSRSVRRKRGWKIYVDENH